MKSVLIVFVLTMVPGLVIAQTTGEAVSEDHTTAVEPRVYDFPDDFVEGVAVVPDSFNVKGEHHGKTTSLIRIRANFVPELLTSVGEI